MRLVEIRNVFYRLSPSFLRLGLLSLLFSLGANTILVEYAIVNGGVMIFSMLSGLEIHHKLMRIIPVLKDEEERFRINLLYVRKQLKLGVAGLIGFVIWVSYYKYTNLLLLSGVFYTSFISLELGRLLRANGRVVAASRLEYYKTLIEGLMLVLLLSYKVNLENIYIAAILSSIISVLILNKEFLTLIRRNNLRLGEKLDSNVWLVLDFKNIFLLIGTLSLRYIQIFDRQFLEEMAGADITSYWILLIGLSMFVYRAVDSMIFQFSLPYLISVKEERNVYFNEAGLIVKRALRWTFIWSIIVGLGSIIYICLLKSESIYSVLRFLPFVTITVISLVIFSLVGMLYFTIGNLVIYSIASVLCLVIILLGSKLISGSIFELSMLISSSYLFVSVIVFILWKREIRFL